MGVFTEKFSKEQEEAILSLYVSKPFSDIYFVYDTIPPEQFATLAASYSRTHEPFQKRLLMSIESGDLPLPKMETIPLDISRAEGEEIKRVYTNFTENWRIPPEKNKRFIQKWAQSYGHNSIKELANVRFVCENIPDLTGKLITGHPLAHPQVKSSRYIDWETVLAKSELNPDLQNFPHADHVIKNLRSIAKTYQEITNKLEDFANNHPLNREYLAHQILTRTDKTASELGRAYDANARKSMLDYSRYLLTPSMLTSLGTSMEVRALEEVITDLLSSPLQEDNRVGNELLVESQKVVPVLMGEKTHAGVSDYQIAVRTFFDENLTKLFDFEKEQHYEVTERTHFVDEARSFTDAFVAAALSWQYGNGSFTQYYKALANDPKKAEHIIDAVFSSRGPYDPVPKPLLMDTPLFETLIDYGADRDNHRHRRGSWLRQTLTTKHGFETPQIIHDAGVHDQYSQALNKLSTIYLGMRTINKYVAQLVVPFAFKSRRLLNWSLGQDIYYTELRSKGTGHDSYRDVAWSIDKHIQDHIPTVAKYIKVDNQTFPQHLIKNARGWYSENKGDD